MWLFETYKNSWLLFYIFLIVILYDLILLEQEQDQNYLKDHWKKQKN